MRALPLEDFFTGPGQNVLEPGEMIVKVNIPRAAREFGQLPSTASFPGTRWTSPS